MATAIPAHRKSVVALTQAAVLMGALVVTGITPVVAQDTSAAPASAAPAHRKLRRARRDLATSFEVPTRGTSVTSRLHLGARADGHGSSCQSEYDAEKRREHRVLINQASMASACSPPPRSRGAAAKRAKGRDPDRGAIAGTVIDAGEVVAAIDFDREGKAAQLDVRPIRGEVHI
jgi:hypothetical protein